VNYKTLNIVYCLGGKARIKKKTNAGTKGKKRSKEKKN
jgi:hypothetical protein